MTKQPVLDMTKNKVKDVLQDYFLVVASREASLLGRKEVFMGKAKFGIFGDGKELPQIAMAKVFRNGDFRSGYYRDQTFMLAIEEFTIEQYFAQLFAHTSIDAEPVSAGRMMNGHFGTRMLDDKGLPKSFFAFRFVIVVLSLMVVIYFKIQNNTAHDSQTSRLSAWQW